MREGLAHRSGEPLRRGAVPDHLLARERHVGGRVGAHRGQLVGPLAELPQSVRDDLGHRFRAADEDAEHLGGDFDVVERAAVGQSVAEQAVDNGQRVFADCSARRRSTTGSQVFQIVGPGSGGVDADAGLGEAAGVDGGQHLWGEIVWDAEQFAHHRGRDDPAVLLRQVERTPRQQQVEPLVGQRADPGSPARRPTSAATAAECARRISPYRSASNTA